MNTIVFTYKCSLDTSVSKIRAPLATGDVAERTGAGPCRVWRQLAATAGADDRQAGREGGVALFRRVRRCNPTSGKKRKQFDLDTLVSKVIRAVWYTIGIKCIGEKIEEPSGRNVQRVFFALKKGLDRGLGSCYNAELAVRYSNYTRVVALSAQAAVR